MLTLLRSSSHRSAYRKYRSSNASRPFQDTLSQVRDLRGHYAAMGLQTPFSVYDRLLEKLSGISGLAFVPCSDLMTPLSGKSQLALRFDIDADPFTALRLARWNARQGIPSTFYILHTAAYYARYENGRIIRNPELKDWVEDFLVSGCELGLHNDAFRVYGEWGMDGAEALITELSWLRGQGARISGTAAHNSFPVYGAENFEIFKNRPVWDRPSFSWRDREIPLGVLDEKKLSLTYEANHPRPHDTPRETESFAWRQTTHDRAAQDPAWMKTYLLQNPYCAWGSDLTLWLTAANRWAVARRTPREAFLWHAGLEEAIDVLKEMPPGARISLILHPIMISGGSQ